MGWFNESRESVKRKQEISDIKSKMKAINAKIIHCKNSLDGCSLIINKYSMNPYKNKSILVQTLTASTYVPSDILVQTMETTSVSLKVRMEELYTELNQYEKMLNDLKTK